jgi:hypothetical protein
VSTLLHVNVYIFTQIAKCNSMDCKKTLFLFCRLKPWHSLTRAARHHLFQPRHPHRHIGPQNRRLHPSGHLLQHRYIKRQSYTPPPKITTSSPRQTVVSRHSCVERPDRVTLCGLKKIRAGFLYPGL